MILIAGNDKSAQTFWMVRHNVDRAIKLIYHLNLLWLVHLISFIKKPHWCLLERSAVTTCFLSRGVQFSLWHIMCHIMTYEVSISSWSDLKKKYLPVFCLEEDFWLIQNFSIAQDKAGQSRKLKCNWALATVCWSWLHHVLPEARFIFDHAPVQHSP